MQSVHPRCPHRTVRLTRPAHRRDCGCAVRDFFGIVRLDGLDPMLAWAMGSSTGHTTVALWNRSTAVAADDYLMVCESTAKDVYWPVNGVQCAPWA